MKNIPSKSSLDYSCRRQRWLKTYGEIQKMVLEEGMDGSVGQPWRWMLDLLHTANEDILNSEQIYSLNRREKNARNHSRKTPDSE